MTQNRGFTMMELVIVIAIASILLTMAVASYRTTVDSSNISSEANALMLDLSYARNEAVKQGLNVVLCSSSNGTTCSNSSSWASGWIVMLPTTGSCTVTSGLAASSVLRVASAVTTNDTIAFTYTGTNTSNGICFSRLGTGSTGKFTLTTTSSTASPSQFNRQCVYVSNAGVPHLVKYGATDSIGSC